LIDLFDPFWGDAKKDQKKKLKVTLLTFQQAHK